MATGNAFQHSAQAGPWNVQLFVPEFASHSVFHAEGFALGGMLHVEPGFWHRPAVAFASSPPGTH